MSKKNSSQSIGNRTRDTPAWIAVPLRIPSLISGMYKSVVTLLPSLPVERCYWYLLTYLLTPWCRVLLEKLTGLQLVKKFPAYHGTRRFITVLTNVRQLSLSWASPIQPICPHPTSWRSILILYTHLRLGLPSDLLSSGFPTKTLAGVLWRLISTNFDGDF